MKPRKNIRTLRERMLLLCGVAVHDSCYLGWLSALPSRGYAGVMWNARDVLARRLRALRQARGVTQEQLAERAGLSVSSVAAYEQGAKFPKSEAFNALGRALAAQEGDDLFDFSSMLTGVSQPASSFAEQDGAVPATAGEVLAAGTPLPPGRSLVELVRILRSEPDDVVAAILRATRTLLPDLRSSAPSIK